MDFFYDGLGRLMAKVAPVDATCTPDLNGPTCVVEVDYYYDGFRRIQEAEFYEPETALYLGLVTPDPIAIYRERDYVYGPDYIDEFICQYDETGAARLMLQDGSYNVVAMETPSNVEQYVFSPYGVLLAADNADANPRGSSGGCFSSGSPLPSGVPTAQCRRRASSPHISFYVAVSMHEASALRMDSVISTGSALQNVRRQSGAGRCAAHLSDSVGGAIRTIRL